MTIYIYIWDKGKQIPMEISGNNMKEGVLMLTHFVTCSILFDP